MKTHNIKPIMKSLALCLLLGASFAGYGAEATQKGDTVIIEVNETSKIYIITKSQSDLAALKNYDLNQMIADLSDQLTDTVQYLEITNETATLSADPKEKDWELNEDKVRIKLGGLEVDVDTDAIDRWDEEDWENTEKETYTIKRAVRTTHHFNMDLGINNWLDDGQFPDVDNAPYSVKPFGSWYVALNAVNQTWLGGPLLVDWGLGVSWYNWKMQDADIQITEGSDEMTFVPAAAPISGIKSKLTASYVNAHIVPMIDFSKGTKKITSYTSTGVKIKRYSKTGLRLGAGAYAGYRLGSHTKFKYKNEGETEKDKEFDNFFLQNFRYGIRGQLGWKGLELFVLYDLNEVFSEGRGPVNPATGEKAALNALTFGITL